METIIIEKTPGQIAEEAAILAHCIVDPQAWIDNAIDKVGEWAIQAKIEENRQDYLNARYLSITVDPETGEETRIENPDYLNRAERDALEEAKRDPLYGKTEAEIAEINKKKALAEISKAQAAAQEQGYTCSNGIKLQTREEDLIRWTQLTATLLAFQPKEVTIRDYDNKNHTLSLAETMQMMGEIAAWGQAALTSVWAAKDQVLADAAEAPSEAG